MISPEKVMPRFSQKRETPALCPGTFVVDKFKFSSSGFVLKITSKAVLINILLRFALKDCQCLQSFLLSFLRRPLHMIQLEGKRVSKLLLSLFVCLCFFATEAKAPIRLVNKTECTQLNWGESLELWQRFVSFLKQNSILQFWNYMQ